MRCSSAETEPPRAYASTLMWREIITPTRRRRTASGGISETGWQARENNNKVPL